MSRLKIFIVSYDVSDHKRLYKVHKKMKGFGDAIHYSVFKCKLSDKDKIELIAALSDIIKHDEDRVMIIDLGSADGDVDGRIDFIGVHLKEDNKQAIIF